MTRLADVERCWPEYRGQIVTAISPPSTAEPRCDELIAGNAEMRALLDKALALLRSVG